MEKRFVVTQCRFHAVDRTKLIISGWMGVEETDSVGIKVMLDKEPLEYHIEKKINTGIAMMEMEEGRTRPKYIYAVHVTLPEDWKKKRELQLTTKDSADENPAKDFQISVMKLKKKVRAGIPCQMQKI